MARTEGIMARWRCGVMSSLLFGWLLVPQGGRADEAEAHLEKIVELKFC